MTESGQWAKVYARMVDGERLTCPICQSSEVKCRFIGDVMSRLGYGLLWCMECGGGGRLSRIAVASHLPMHDWDSDLALSGVPDIDDFG